MPKVVIEVSKETHKILINYRNVKSKRYGKKYLKSDLVAEIVENVIPEIQHEIIEMENEMESFKTVKTKENA